MKKCVCWCLSIIELKNARWNIEIRIFVVSPVCKLPFDTNCRVVSYGNRIDILLPSYPLVVSCVCEGSSRSTHEFSHLVLTSLVDAFARNIVGVTRAKRVTCSDAAWFISAVSDGLGRESEITDLTCNVGGVKTGAICYFARTVSENNLGSRVLCQFEDFVHAGGFVRGGRWKIWSDKNKIVLRALWGVTLNSLKKTNRRKHLLLYVVFRNMG